MSKHIVSLTPDLDDFVLSSVESGRFEDTNELVRTALTVFHREQEAAANRRHASAIAEIDVFRKLWEASPHVAFSPSRH
ncbi:MAG: type II toxin-antitoxin system ParD family antitoxin [Terracidiphilus sp.]